MDTLLNSICNSPVRYCCQVLLSVDYCMSDIVKCWHLQHVSCQHWLHTVSYIPDTDPNPIQITSPLVHMHQGGTHCNLWGLGGNCRSLLRVREHLFPYTGESLRFPYGSLVLHQLFFCCRTKKNKGDGRGRGYNLQILSILPPPSLILPPSPPPPFPKKTYLYFPLSPIPSTTCPHCWLNGCHQMVNSLLVCAHSRWCNCSGGLITLANGVIECDAKQCVPGLGTSAWVQTLPPIEHIPPASKIGLTVKYCQPFHAPCQILSNVEC